MKGVRILVHAVRQVAGNLGMALRVSALPLALLVGLFVLLGGVFASAFAEMSEAPSGSSFAAFFFGVLAAILIAWMLLAWIAVRWHRYVLLEEGSGWIPPWSAGLVGRYMLQTFLIGLVVAVGAMGATLILLLIAGAVDAWRFLVLLAVQLVAAWVGLRLSISLPAVALGERMTLGEAWARTRPAAGAIAALTGLLFALNLGMSALVSLATIAGQPAMLATILSLPLDWALALLLVAILTTLYGHLVEGRELV